MANPNLPPNQTWALIWPKDPQPGNAAHWPPGKRLKDILTGKGPRIHFATLAHGPNQIRHHWSGWNGVREGQGYVDVNAAEEAQWELKRSRLCYPFSKLKLMGRQGDEKYDYRTRKYGEPNNRTWSKVSYGNAHVEGANLEMANPEHVRDGNGTMYTYDGWQEAFGGNNN
ncbi:hypothetical protein AJ79_01551 [Helicocarpus griseus UAMH5409]|uniref:Uncharacterized protein n=1 Tax=Helicocarpus griseus UAMH5409 TaxID=1447875 RepID=A0A2B7Y6E5_9EURO|nr:hypothetical protein AJ79_01551 [Helicocarpus griseus UAMH5409]